MSKFKNFPVDKKNLLPFLTPTSKGTNWYDPPPENVVTSRQIGRILLQFHQVAAAIDEYHNKKIKLNFLDVGTGNGMLPNLIAKYCKSNLSVGMDPYEDGEHQTSWPKGTKKEIVDKIKKILNRKFLTINDYRSLISFEGLSSKPKQIKLFNNNKIWTFKKKFINELPKKRKYNFIFAKCIDHIPDWNNLFFHISNISEKDCTLFIKHNSFFSYNGAHRYASTFIPWGHVLLNEKDYNNYCKKFHKNRYKHMIDFYRNGLSYPRNTLDDLFNILSKNNWKIVHLEQSNKKKYLDQIKLAGGTKKLLNDTKKNFSNLSLSELISDRIIIIAKKI